MCSILNEITLLDFFTISEIIIDFFKNKTNYKKIRDLMNLMKNIDKKYERRFIETVGNKKNDCFEKIY